MSKRISEKVAVYATGRYSVKVAILCHYLVSIRPFFSRIICNDNKFYFVFIFFL